MADKELLAFDAPDLDLFHPDARMKPLNWRLRGTGHCMDKRITNTEGGSFNSHYESRFWQQPRHVAGVLLYASFALQLCNRRRKWRYGSDYAYTIGRAMSDLQTPEWVGADCARRTFIAPVTA